MKIEVRSGPDEGLKYEAEADETIVIGREASCELTLSDGEVSRRHAEVRRVGSVTTVCDLDSRNGTYVNGKRVNEKQVFSGDCLRIGKTEFELTGLPAGPLDASAFEMNRGDATVVMSLDHRAADLLASKSESRSQTEMVHENEVLREICRISQIVAAGEDTDAILSSVLDRLHEVLSADTVCMLKRENEDCEWQVALTSLQTGDAKDLTVSSTIVNEAVNGGQAIIATNPLTDERFSASQSIVAQHISSALCLPLKTKDEFNGVVVLDRRGSEGVFKPIDLRLAASVVNILGVFIEKQEFEAESQKRARLAVIGEVVAGLAHYIKNIVTGFQLSLGGLESAINDGDIKYAKSFLETTTAEKDRISDLMLNMLSYAKDREPQREPLRLNEVLAGVIAPYVQTLQEEGVELRMDCPPDIPEVFAEGVALHRVFLNLLVNARQALRNVEKGKEKMLRLTARPLPDGTAVEVLWRDTGCGIPKEKLQDIFHAFFSTKGSGGTGLGLAVVRKIIDENQGQISVDSCEGEWTEFRIALPAADTAKKEADPTVGVQSA